jgi:hypothetical protein
VSEYHEGERVHTQPEGRDGFVVGTGKVRVDGEDLSVVVVDFKDGTGDVLPFFESDIETIEPEGYFVEVAYVFKAEVKSFSEFDAEVALREALVEALTAYSGAVILVSHDMHLLSLVADRLWLVKDGKAMPYDGDLADYKALVLAADRPNQDKQHAIARAEIAAAAEKAEKSKQAAPASKATYKQKFRVEKAEQEVEKARAALELLDRDLGDPDTFAHKADAEAKLKSRAKLQAQLDAAEAEWLEALEAIEG